jgi:quinol monooxygenase YgiN
VQKDASSSATRTLEGWLNKIIIGTLIGMLACSFSVGAEEAQMTRLSKITINAEHLPAYRDALAEEVRASMQLEPGVLSLYAVFEKEDPTRLTILEIYASRQAYEQHVKSAHFLKYKDGTLHMVKSLELVDVDPLLPELKIK